jgi:hypothetical protein
MLLPERARAQERGGGRVRCAGWGGWGGWGDWGDWGVWVVAGGAARVCGLWRVGRLGCVGWGGWGGWGVGWGGLGVWRAGAGGLRGAGERAVASTSDSTGRDWLA